MLNMVEFLSSLVWWAGLFAVVTTFAVGVAAIFSGLRDRRRRRALLRERDAWARELSGEIDRLPEFSETQ